MTSREEAAGCGLRATAGKVTAKELAADDMMYEPLFKPDDRVTRRRDGARGVVTSLSSDRTRALCTFGSSGSYYALAELEHSPRIERLPLDTLVAIESDRTTVTRGKVTDVYAEGGNDLYEVSNEETSISGLRREELRVLNTEETTANRSPLIAADAPSNPLNIPYGATVEIIHSGERGIVKSCTMTQSGYIYTVVCDKTTLIGSFYRREIRMLCDEEIAHKPKPPMVGATAPVGPTVPIEPSFDYLNSPGPAVLSPLAAARSPQPAVSLVNHPRHYNTNPSGVECITVVQHMTFNVGNAVKYLWRAGEKGALIQDLEKARRYIDFEIERLGKETKK